MVGLLVGRLATAAIHKSKSLPSFFCSSSSSSVSANGFAFVSLPASLRSSSSSSASLCYLICFLKKPKPPSSSLASFATLRSLHTLQEEGAQQTQHQHHHLEDETEYEGESTDGWEEEEETESELGDGGDGGGVVLQNVCWGEQVLSVARELLLQFGDDMQLFSFKTTPRGYIYVRLDKLSEKYGCPSVEEMESYNRQYKERLDELGAKGDIPDDLAIEISSPGALRILKVPDDLVRFKDMPMTVCYGEGSGSQQIEKSDILVLDSIEPESESCVWKLADVKENRDPLSKGRPLSRKRRDWRLKVPYAACRKVMLYIAW